MDCGHQCVHHSCCFFTEMLLTKIQFVLIAAVLKENILIDLIPITFQITFLFF